MSKTYVLVGAGSGIGFSLAQQLLSAGNKVINLSRRPEHDLPGVIHLQYDVTSPLFPAELLPEKIDGLVYLPGTIQLKPFHRLTDAEFNQEMEINFLGAVRSIRGCLPALKAAENASVVLFSSVAAETGMPFHASIASAKSAVEGLTRSLAAEYAPLIRFNCISPSLTDTPLASKLLGSDEKKTAAAQRHPLKKTGSPEEIASLANFLLTQGGFITGQVIHADGGLSTLRV